MPTGQKLVTGTNGCEWGATAAGGGAYSGGCAFAPGAASRFAYSWDPSAANLTMTYTAGADAEQHVDAVVTIHAEETFFDLRLTLTNHAPQVVQTVNFPVDLYGDANTVQAGYAPKFLPGVRFAPAFFSRFGNDVFTYPSRWAFADFLALDVGSAHLAMYSVDPPPAPLAPVDFGFLHNGGSIPCAGTSYCITHAFHTWVATGSTWTSPVVRVRVGDPVEQDDRRLPHGERHRRLSDCRGQARRAARHARAGAADQGRHAEGRRARVRGLVAGARQSARPALIHPVAFGPGGFDKTDPDVLPPDNSVGSIDRAARGVLGRPLPRRPRHALPERELVEPVSRRPSSNCRPTSARAAWPSRTAPASR